MPAQTIQQFAGLDLRSDVQEIPGAIDALNVDFDATGRVRTRDGYTQVSAGSSDIGITAMVMQGTTGNFVTTALTQRARAYTSAGAVIASSAALADTPLTLANFGTPANNYVYAGIGNAVNTLARWDGAAWSYPASGYSGYYVAVTPWDNRLILASQTSPTADLHKVRFSDTGAAETYTANNYVDLTPGDNEIITGLCVWRDKVFVFKQTKFFVFYGVSADQTGQPVFNYRTVSTGQGAARILGQSCVVMDDAVYFTSQNGLFRTTGGSPEKVSGPVDPLFAIGSAAYFTGSFDGSSVFTPSRFRKKILISFAPATTDYVLVFDTERNSWAYWDLSMYVALEYSTIAGATPILLFAAADGKIHKMGSAFTADNGTAIASKYRTGFLDFGAPEQEKWIRQMMLSGTGTVNVKTAVNDAVALSSATSVAMGASPAVGTGRWSQGTRGRNISVDISASSGAWSLSHLSLDIGGMRAAGVRAA